MIVNEIAETTTLGASGLGVRRMGIGSDSGVPADALEWAFERGINFFYWGSRRRPGMKQAIRRLARKQREKMVIALQTYDPTGLVLGRTFTQGLRALAIDYADVLILGMRNGPIPQRILDKAVELKERGLAKHLCVSAHDRSAYRRHLEARIFDLIMVRYNAAHRGADRDVFPLLEEHRPARSDLLQRHALGPSLRSALDARRRQAPRIRPTSTGTLFPIRTSRWSSPLRRPSSSSGRT